MSYELFIAGRYLKSKRKTGFISLITYISMLGVMIGVAALIIVLAVMNGFEKEVRSRFIGFGSHIELRTFHNKGISESEGIRERIKDIHHIVGVSEYINEKALIISKSRKQGVAIKGVNPQTIVEVSDIEDDINYGAFDLGQIENNGRAYPGIVLGTYLADKLVVDLGDRVQILSPAGIGPMLLNSTPNVRTFVVTGFFETGLYEFDDLFAYVAIPEAQRLFEMKNMVSGLEVKLDDLDEADDVAAVIEERLGYPYHAVTWFQLNKNLFSWMQLEKWGMFVVLSLIIMVAAFNIVSTLIMIVLEKTKEVGILKSMGATSRSIRRIFVYEGLIGGVIGTFLGCAIGFVMCWLQQEYQLISLPPDVYLISALPVVMNKLDFLFITTVALLLCYLATVYPALKASRLEPVEAIRYE